MLLYRETDDQSRTAKDAQIDLNGLERLSNALNDKRSPDESEGVNCRGSKTVSHA